MQERVGRSRRLLTVTLAMACLVAVLHIATASATATTCSVTATDGLETRMLGTRTYELYVPPGLPANIVGAPLLLSMHGLGSSGVRTAGTVPWLTHAAQAGFIVAFPDGEGGAWKLAEGSTDVDFLRSVVADIESTYCVDGSRVHAAGHSLGGYMAQRLACDAADIFASVAAYAAGSPILTSGSGGCTPQRGISVALYHGTDDAIVPLSAGTASLAEWIDRLGCTLPPTTQTLTAGTAATYRGCIDRQVVTWRQYEGQGHRWPTGVTGADIRDGMWNHFLTHPHPTR